MGVPFARPQDCLQLRDAHREGAFNATNNAGITGYTNIETTTATADFAPEVVTATSEGRVVTTCSSSPEVDRG